MGLQHRSVALVSLAVMAACSPAAEAPDPPVLEDDRGVPAERLHADSSACPGAFVDATPEAGQNDGFTVAGQDRDFWLALPDPIGNAPRPIFFALNGTGDDGKFFYDSSKLDPFVERGFIVVAPSSAGNGTVWPVWDALRRPDELDLPNADVEYFDALLECLAAHLPVDAKRVYVGGHSAGGHMTHYLLQRRSDVIAGGIAASGVFEMTSPAGESTIDETYALVTFGGEQDIWGGEADGEELTVPSFNFVEQAALASRFYDERPTVGQAYCHEDLGHAWLSSINGWMADQLLAHPKGVSGADDDELPALPEGSAATCANDVFSYDSGLTVTCVGDAVPQCQGACQMFGDCAVVNATVGPVLAEQLGMIGFSGDSNTECGGCIAWCDERGRDAADVEVLDCIAQAEAGPQCGAGVEGAQPLIDALNTCCDGRTDSTYCRDVCTAILTNDVAADFFPTCQAM